MTAPEDERTLITVASTDKRRISDLESTTAASAAEEDNPEWLYAEWRAGRRNIQSLVPLIPLNVAFQWHIQRRLSDAEFEALMADLEIQEVVIGDLPAQKTATPDTTQGTDSAVMAFYARMAGFDLVSLHEVVTELDMKPVLLSKTPLVDGIGVRMNFAVGPDDSLAKAGTPPQLTVLCRAYIASGSLQSSLKCEAVFSAGGMERDLYCRIIVPLPLHKGGRRRLQPAVLDIETRQPVLLPPAVAELFHEKNLFDLRLLKKPGAPAGGIGSAVKGALGVLFNK